MPQSKTEPFLPEMHSCSARHNEQDAAACVASPRSKWERLCPTQYFATTNRSAKHSLPQLTFGLTREKMVLSSKCMNPADGKIEEFLDNEYEMRPCERDNGDPERNEREAEEAAGAAPYLKLPAQT